MKKPIFKPKPGQVDYTKAHWAPVINCVLKYQSKILLVKRSANLKYSPGYWSGISGFLDDYRSLLEKVTLEIKEELGLSRKQIKRIRLGGIFDQEDKQYKKIWIVHFLLVEVKTDKVKIDWEAQEYKWLTLSEAKKLRLLPGFRQILDKLSPWIEQKNN
ncbi:MAG: NUDIX domain-containing protein [Patescibacteria group bacterium]|jgi:ADP-ribose pyrophosphatase YjhB (NUDIX family)